MATKEREYLESNTDLARESRDAVPGRVEREIHADGYTATFYTDVSQLDPTYDYCWARMKIPGTSNDDIDNLSRKRREGWEPVPYKDAAHLSDDLSFLPGREAKPTIIERSGSLFMRRLKKYGDIARSAKRERTEEQMRGIQEFVDGGKNNTFAERNETTISTVKTGKPTTF